jgi:hypothetical protein
MLGGDVLVIIHTCDLRCVVLIMLKADILEIWSLVLPLCQFDEYHEHFSYRWFSFRKLFNYCYSLLLPNSRSTLFSNFQLAFLMSY